MRSTDDNPTARHFTTWTEIACCLILLAFCGCGDPQVVRIFADRPVIFDGDGDRIDEPTLSLGETVEGEFVPIVEGSGVTIIDGFQGGTWIHLSIRVTGLQPDGLVEVSLGDISEVRFGLRLTRTNDGVLEANDIPLPVPLSLDEVATLDGQTIEIKAAFESLGQRVDHSTEVVLRRRVEP